MAANNSSSASGDATMNALELETAEDEKRSLARAQNGETTTGVGFRKNSKKSENGKDSGASTASASSSNGGGGGSGFFVRNVFAVGVLGVAAFMLVRSYFNVLPDAGQLMNTDMAAEHYVEHYHHTSSFGGVSNVGHDHLYKGTCAARMRDGRSFFLPTSLNAHAVPSLSAENLQNKYGHYVHDEFRSPYASHFYDMGGTELEQEQKKYEAKMEEVRNTWGYWDLEHREGKSVDFSQVPHKDMPADNFPEDAWQRDEEYVRKFIDQGKALVDRVIEGIYTEYGHPKVKPDGTTLSEEELKKREQYFRVLHNGDHNNDKFGVSELSREAWDALQRKLLHAIMTHDEFYVVLAGHSAAAGHGNNFLQNRVMTFHHLMEPIFDKLGVRLITRNMAQGGVGTFPSVLGGADIYGERDIFIWDSAMTEGHKHVQELFNRQAILAGERVPIIITSVPHDIVEVTGGKGWVGKFTLGWEIPWIAKTESLEKMTDMPFAIQGLFCAKGVDFCNKGDHKFSATCWEDRSDVEPSAPQGKVGGQVRWHPGDKYHLFQGRWLALTVLKALEAAFVTWEEGLEEHGYPLADTYWHVGEAYSEIKTNMRRHIKENPGASDCEQKFQDIREIGRICNVPLHAYGEWTPRINPETNSLRSIVRTAPNGYKPYIDVEPEYKGIDVLPHVQRIPDGHVDVHAIAIATNREPPKQIECPDEGDDNDADDNDANDDNGGPENQDDGDEATGRGLLRAPIKISENEVPKIKATSLSESATSMVMQSSTNGSSLQSRRLNDEIVPGQGWSWHLGFEGFCDGSSMSECDRGYGNNCLMSGHNDARAGLIGDALSGWLVMDVPNVKHGLILLRMEWWVPGNENARTEGWTEENNGKTLEEEPKFDFPLKGPAKDRRELEQMENRLLGGAKKDKLPDGFLFDLAVNGKIKTMEAEEFLKYKDEIGANVALWPALNELLTEDIVGEVNEMEPWKHEDGETYEVAIRIRLKDGGSNDDAKRAATIKISHVYYA